MSIIILSFYRFKGEKLEREDVDVLLKECCEAEDEDGYVPYERKFHFLDTVLILNATLIITTCCLSQYI